MPHHSVRHLIYPFMDGLLVVILILYDVWIYTVKIRLLSVFIAGIADNREIHLSITFPKTFPFIVVVYCFSA